MGRVLQEKRAIVGTSTVTNTISYAYNLDGSLATTTYPNTGKSVSYVMDGSGRPIALKNYTDAINYVQGVHYAPFGGITGMTYGDQPITFTNSYNNRQQPLRLSASTTAATIMSLCYDFHAKVAISSGPCSFAASTTGDNGSVFQIVNTRDNNRTQNFLYDSLNRIQQAYSNATSGATSWGETFSNTATAPGVAPSTAGIDSWGNLTNRSGVTGKTNTEPLGCPANIKNQLTTCSLSYDAAGNVTANASAAYTYDGDNRITNTAGYTYTYDGDGKRVKKCNACTSASGGTLYWTGIGNDNLAESDLAGTIQKEYVFFAGKRVARRDVPNTPSVKYYFSDYLGSTSLITNTTGTMPPLEESDYYPYGGEIVITNSDPNNYKFTGKERDQETCSTACLDNFGARYDASSMGRFMTPDPLMASAKVWNPQTWNRYTYALNNPLKYMDPTGMNEVTADQCAKDKNCVTVKVNVIYDQNANDGKGLTDKQKADFEKGQLQNAKDQYGNADIHLDVTYASGEINSKGNLTGVEKGALNVFVTDSGDAASAYSGGYAISQINVRSTNREDLPHEMAHHFMGDMSSLLGRTLAKDPTGISVAFDNAFTDVTNDTGRFIMNHITPHLPNYPSGQPATVFNPQARDFQNRITPQTQPR